MTCTTNITAKDRMQVRAFQAFFHAAIIGGYDNNYVLASAAVNSSDEIMDKLLSDNPDIIDQWEERNDEEIA